MKRLLRKKNFLGVKMLPDLRNGWYRYTEFIKAMKAVEKTANKHTAWLNQGINCKYIDIRVDMRTGDFVVKDGYGAIIPHEQLMEFLSIGGNNE